MLFTFSTAILAVLICASDGLSVAKSREDEARHFKDATTGINHQEFTAEELADLFGVRQHDDDVPLYHPAVVKGNRKLQKDENHVISVSMLGDEMNIHLTKNDNIIPDIHTTEFVAKDGTRTSYKGTRGEFSMGRVENDENSHVALYHTAKGISGTIRTKDDMLIIKPLPKRMANDQANHIVYRLLDLPKDHEINQYIHRIDGEKNDAMQARTRSRRSVEDHPKKIMELMIVADWKMLEFYTREFLPEYLLTMGCILAGLFADDSLEWPIDVRVTRTVILEKDELLAQNTDDQLTKFTAWVRENNNFADDTDPEHVDIAILMSRNGCKGGGSCGIEGLANVNICGTSSVAVGNDRGLASATTFAHEIAHTLNAEHDSGDKCPSGINIMSSGSTAGGRQSFEWSKCTSDRFIETFKLKDSSCLDDEPETKAECTYKLYGQVYNATQQCQFVYGPEFGECKPYKDRCDYLFCRHKQEMRCERLTFASLHGTECGVRKWCIKGKCEPDGTPAPPAVDGGWSKWSDFTQCSRPCGVGVQWRERQCNNPEPKDGGLWCNPKSTDRGNERDDYESCNMQDCIKNKETNEKYAKGTMYGSSLEDRNRLCRKVDAAKVFCKYCQKYVNPCDLVCGKETSGVLEGFVQDGTACITKKTEKEGLCIHGICVKHGCDMVLDSNIEKDRCGKCGGNGDFCKPISGKDSRKLTGFGKHIVTHIPAGTTDVEISESSATRNFLGFSYEGSDSLIMRIPSYSRKMDIGHGVTVEYIMNGFTFPDKLIFHGKLTRPLVVWLVNYYYGTEKGIEWHYTKNFDIPEAFTATHWTSGKWEECSTTCGHEGKQKRDVMCQREDETNINPSKCTIGKPAAVQDCNRVDCPPRWVISAWTKCSKPCATGERTRTIECIVPSKDGVDNTVADSECSEAKPTDATEEVCNAIDCDPRWEIKECPVTCGGIGKRRPIECWRVDTLGKDAMEEDMACSKLPKVEREVCENAASCSDETHDFDGPHWHTEDWTKCNKRCKQTRDVHCFGEDENNLPHSECELTIPPSEQACKSGGCPKWVLSKWTKCSSKCGSGERTRSITCVVPTADGGDEVVDDGECEGSPRSDATTEECNVIDCEPRWEIKSEFGECSVSCGGGTMQRSVECWRKNKLGEDEHKDNNACENLRSINSEECNVDEPCPTWRTKHSPCSVTCGHGQQKEIVECASHIEVFDDSMCPTASKPPSAGSISCDKGPCSGPIWTIQDGECSKSCGGGKLSETVVCQDIETESILSDVKCKDSEKPSATTKECNFDVCPIEHNWMLTDSECSVACGGGEQTVDAHCVRENTGEQVADVECDPSTKPNSKTKACNAHACGSFHWKKKSSGCSVTCGAGKELWTAICVHGKEAVSDDRCNINTKPTYAHPPSCNIGDCPKGVTYYWETRDLGCPVQCGTGVHDVEVECAEQIGEEVTIVGAEFCKGMKKGIEAPKKCKHLPPCYKLGVHHGSCDSPCGHQIRQVHCIEISSNMTVDFHNCDKSANAGASYKPRKCHGNCPKGGAGKPLSIVELGCYTDENPKIGTNVDLKTWDSFIQKCAVEAAESHQETFAMKSDGSCSDSAEDYTEKDGFSHECMSAMGGVKQTFVFQFHSFK